MARIYISAPVTGYDYEERKRYFSRIERKIVKDGNTAVNPMRLTCEGMTHKDAMRICLKKLLICDEVHAFGLYEKSEGCMVELIVADAAGIKVVRHNTEREDVL